MMDPEEWLFPDDQEKQRRENTDRYWVQWFRGTGGGAVPGPTTVGNHWEFSTSWISYPQGMDYGVSSNSITITTTADPAVPTPRQSGDNGPFDTRNRFVRNDIIRRSRR